eukprot:393874_1
MSASSLDKFSRRAQEAENKLRSLQAQIDALSSSSSRSQSDEKSEWELVYWPLRNRGNFVRLVFEEAGVPYQDNQDMENIKSRIRSDHYGSQTREQGAAYQVMGPPFIRNGDFILSQSIVCMGYLSQKFGIRPRSDEDHALAQMIGGNCSDIMVELYKLKPKNKDEIFVYLKDRFQVWLDILENPLEVNNLTFYFDNRCTQADLAVFNLLDGVEELFGQDSFQKYVVATHKYLADYYARLKQRKSIQRLMKKQHAMFSFHPKDGVKIPCPELIEQKASAWDNARDIIRATSFTSDGIVPDVVDDEPLDLLTLEYRVEATNKVFKVKRMGQTLTPMQVQDAPYNVRFKSVDKRKLYTIILTDPDARDRAKHEFREWVHFVKINVSGADLTTTGDTIVKYVGSGPPQGTGMHRYCWLVYEQCNGRIDVDKCGQKQLKSGGGNGEGRRSWKARKFVSDNSLGSLVAGTYYYAEYDAFVPKLYAWLQGKGSYKTQVIRVATRQRIV